MVTSRCSDAKAENPFLENLLNRKALFVSTVAVIAVVEIFLQRYIHFPNWQNKVFSPRPRDLSSAASSQQREFVLCYHPRERRFDLWRPALLVLCPSSPFFSFTTPPRLAVPVRFKCALYKYTVIQLSKSKVTSPVEVIYGYTVIISEILGHSEGLSKYSLV